MPGLQIKTLRFSEVNNLHEVTQSFQYLLRCNYALDTVLGPGETAARTADRALLSWSPILLWGRQTINKLWLARREKHYGERFKSSWGIGLRQKWLVVAT